METLEVQVECEILQNVSPTESWDCAAFPPDTGVLDPNKRLFEILKQLSR